MQIPWDTIKRQNLQIMMMEQLQAKGKSNIFNKITTEQVLRGEHPDFGMYVEQQTSQRSLSPHHIIVRKLNWETERKILSTEKHQVTSYVLELENHNTVRITAGCSTETLKVRRAWNYIFQMLENSNCQSRLLYPANYLSEQRERELSMILTSRRNL